MTDILSKFGVNLVLCAVSYPRKSCLFGTPGNGVESSITRPQLLAVRTVEMRHQVAHA